MLNYGEALKYQREIRGLSQSELAQKTGLKQQTISWSETNKGLPNIDFWLSLYLRDDYPDNKPCEDDPAEDQPYFQGFFFVHGHIYFVSALRTHPVFHFRAAFSAVHGFGIARRIFISFRHTLFPPVFFFSFLL